LVSRLAALPAARLEEPDEALLTLVLRRLCRERFMELSDKAAAYLATHMERTFACAHAVAAELDRSVVRAARPVALPQAREALARVRAAWTDRGDTP
jgi:chromosomal replication initiation ATPase DnaA